MQISIWEGSEKTALAELPIIPSIGNGIVLNGNLFRVTDIVHVIKSTRLDEVQISVEED